MFEELKKRLYMFKDKDNKTNFKQLCVLLTSAASIIKNLESSSVWDQPPRTWMQDEMQPQGGDR